MIGILLSFSQNIEPNVLNIITAVLELLIVLCYIVLKFVPPGTKTFDVFKNILKGSKIIKNKLDEITIKKEEIKDGARNSTAETDKSVGTEPDKSDTSEPDKSD